MGGTSSLIRGPSPADPRVEDTQSAGNKWTQEKKLTANDANKRDRLGVTVSLDGNRALVGAYHYDSEEADNAGAAYMFEADGGQWDQIKKLVAEDIGANDRFGQAVSLDGDRALVEAFRKDVQRDDEAGAAYVFTKEPSEDSTTMTPSPSDNGLIYLSRIAAGSTGTLIRFLIEDPESDELKKKGYRLLGALLTDGLISFIQQSRTFVLLVIIALGCVVIGIVIVTVARKRELFSFG